MLRLSLRTFAERWQLFAGSIITVCAGVALVQSSLLILISLATYEVPGTLPVLVRLRLEKTFTGGVSLLGVTTGFAVFLTAFIVSSTFAFTVAQRRRDLALLRLIGGSRGNVRRLLLSEAAVLGSIGTALGVPFGLLVMKLQTALLVRLELIPDGFSARFQWWILGVAVGVGLGVSLAGVFFAAGRAARVRPLEALRDNENVHRVMTRGRWIIGVLLLLGATAMTITAGFLPAAGAIPVSINAALVAATALSVLSPVAVPAMGRVFGLLFRGTVGSLAQANLRDGIRRNASTAAPLLVLIAMLIAQWGSAQTVASSAAAQLRRDTHGDLVVNGPVPPVAGVRLASAERQVPVFSSYTKEKEDEAPRVTTSETIATVIDPDAYRRTHTAPMAEGSLAELHGETVAVGGGYKTKQSLELGSVISARIGDREVRLRVVAFLPSGMAGGPAMLLPADLVPAPLLAGAPVQTVLHTERDPATVAADLRARGASVITMTDWLAEQARQGDEMQSKISAVVLGVSGLYALIAVINAVVIGAAARRREFAAARVTGLGRAQVVRMALAEAFGVTGIALALGALASLTALVGIGAAAGRITGFGGITVPWLMVATAAAGAFVVVGSASVWTTLTATRARPVTLISARE